MVKKIKALKSNKSGFKAIHRGKYKNTYKVRTMESEKKKK